MDTVTTVEPGTDRRTRIRSLRSRAASLRSQAATLPALLAVTYERRADELDAEALLLTAGS